MEFEPRRHEISPLMPLLLGAMKPTRSMSNTTFYSLFVDDAPSSVLFKNCPF